MLPRFTTVLVSLLAAACAGATTGSAFEFRPSDSPLRYDVTVSGDVIAETPMGRMASETESDATISLNVGERMESGWTVTATFEALQVTAEGSLGGGTVNAESILGKSYLGSLSESGLISISEAPVVSGSLSDNLDPAALLTELLVPLPPEGAADVESWPVSSTVISDAAVHLTSTFEGFARFAGDTIWHGKPATLIVAEGDIEIEGSGAPAGAPAEIDLFLSGESARTYVWDVERRVMLASLVTGEADGSLTVAGMDFEIPARFVNKQEVTLRR